MVVLEQTVLVVCAVCPVVFFVPHMTVHNRGLSGLERMGAGRDPTMLPLQKSHC